MLTASGLLLAFALGAIAAGSTSPLLAVVLAAAVLLALLDDAAGRVRR